MPPLQNIQDVAQRSSLRGRDNANTPGQRWNRLLAFRSEQSFGLELGLELFERKLQRSRALGLNVLGRDLELTAIFVDGYAPAHHHLQPVSRTKAEQPRR